MRADLVGLDMRAEPGAEGLCEFVHLCAVTRKDSAVDDESRGPERIEVLALVLVDEVLLLGLAADVVRGPRLLRNERVSLGVLLCAHDGRGRGGRGMAEACVGMVARRWGAAGADACGRRKAEEGTPQQRTDRWQAEELTESARPCKIIASD